MNIQIWVAISTYLIVASVKHMQKSNLSVDEITQIIGISVFDKASLKELLTENQIIRTAQNTTYLISKLNSSAIIQKLNFEGSFFSLTKVLNQLHATNGIGMVRAVGYKAIGLHSGNDEDKKLVIEIYLDTVK